MSEAVSADFDGNIGGEGARHAAARSRAFQVLAWALAYPEEDLVDAIRSGAVAEALTTALAALDPALAANVNRVSLRSTGDADDLAVEYTRLFDVGAKGPPCPLYGGLYGGARMKVMEEAVRFYNFFGLQLSEDPHELPDHLLTELEFLHFLSYREAKAFESGEDTDSWRRAQRDFVTRHPGRWVPKLVERLEKNAPPLYLREVIRLLDEVLQSEVDRLERETADSPALNDSGTLPM